MLNSLILGDCLQVLKSIPSDSIDLCYIDPPFFSNRNYEVIWGDKGEIRSFEDRWAGGMEHYIGWLKERVEQIYRVLKPTGSFYLHCDWHANAEIKVNILNKLFGSNNFRNEIIWHYGSGGRSVKDFSRKHDSIFRYTKGKKYTFNGEEVGEIRGIKKRNNMKKNTDEDGRVFFSIKANGKIYKYYEDEKIIPDDVWSMSHLQQKDPERIGYPTQKPEKLLERIIKASSNEGDTVLDCFVGGGTTVAVAEKLNRKWIGIDQSVQAIKVSEFRLNRARNLFTQPFEVRLHKYDRDKLFNMNPFEFESFIVQQIGGTANKKQRGDGGIDGKMADGTPIQVKQQENITGPKLRQFFYDAEAFDRKLFEQKIANKEACGTIIAFSFGKGAVEEVAKIKNEKGCIFNLVKVEDIVPIAKKPSVKLVVELVNPLTLTPRSMSDPLQGVQEKTTEVPISKGAGGLNTETPPVKGSGGLKQAYNFIIKAKAEDGSSIEFYSFEIWLNTEINTNPRSKSDPLKVVQEKTTEVPISKGAGGLNTETPPVKGAGGLNQIIFSDYRNKNGQIEYELKEGKYEIIGRAVDNNGLEGEDRVEITVG